MTRQRSLAALLLGAACSSPPPTAPNWVDGVASADVPPALQSRLRASISSDVLELAGRGRGGLAVVGSDRARLVLDHPVGGTAMAVSMGPDGLAVTIPARRTHLVSPAASRALGAVSGGLAGSDTIVAVLAGRLPLAVSSSRRWQAAPGGGRVRLEGPRGLVVDALLDEGCRCPVQTVLRDAQHSVLLTASYRDWSEGDAGLRPGGSTLEIPALDLGIDLDFDRWSAEAPAAPIDLTAPEGFDRQPLQPALDRLGEQALRAAMRAGADRPRR